MFDDLHDPNQPEASMNDRADVTERARDIRRRRAAWMGAGAAVLIIAATVGVIAATRNDDSKKITPLLPDETTLPVVSSDASTTVVSVPTTAVPATTIPETIVADVSTSLPSTVTTVVESVVPVTVNGDSSSSSALATTTTTTAVETTTTVPVITRPIAAITGDGTAVLVALDGAQTVLQAGSDPDDPGPLEGESTYIDAVAVTGDGSVAIVGDCCEPGVGYIHRYYLPDTTSTDGTFGHGPTISPDGTKVVLGRLQALSLIDVNLAEIGSTAEDFLGDGTENGFVWLDNNRFVVLSASPADAVRLQLMTIAADNTFQAGVVSDLVSPDAYSVRMAGTGPGVIYLTGIAPATLTAVDSTTLQAVPASDIALPAPALSAWLQDGQLRWVDTDRHLHVGDTVMPGEYTWVR